MSVVTAPPGAQVSVMTPAVGEWQKLGKGPLKVDGLVVVRKRYPDGAIDYWLYDGARVLPPNLEKPSYASPAYAAGADYPLELVFLATLPGYTDAASIVKINRYELDRLFGQADPALKVELKLPRAAAGTPPPAPGAPTPRPGESMPK